MKYLLSKKLLFSLILFIPLLVEARDISGQYLCNNVYVANTEIAERPDGSIKLDMQFYKGIDIREINTILVPINEEKSIFETKEDTKNPLRVVVSDDAVELYYMNQARAIKDYFLLCTDKKLLKNLMKEKNLKSISKQQLAMIKEEKYKSEYSSKPAVFIPSNPTSDFHAKNAGKVIFFSEKPEIGKEDMSKIKTQFVLGEEIWAIAYFPVALEKLPRLMDTNHENFLEVGFFDYTPNLTEEERTIGSQSVLALDETMKKQNYFIFQVIPTTSAYNNVDIESAVWIVNKIKDLGTFNHTIKITMGDDYDYDDSVNDYQPYYENLFTGTFELDMSDKETVEKWSKSLNDSEFESREMPNVPRAPASFEADIISRLNGLNDRRGWDRKWIKVLNDGAWNWIIRRDEFGFITERYAGFIGVFEDDEGCGYMKLTLKQKYIDNGQFEETMYWDYEGRAYYVSCEKAK